MIVNLESQRILFLSQKEENKTTTQRKHYPETWDWARQEMAIFKDECDSPHNRKLGYIRTLAVARCSIWRSCDVLKMIRDIIQNLGQGLRPIYKPFFTFFYSWVRWIWVGQIIHSRSWSVSSLRLLTFENVSLIHMITLWHKPLGDNDNMM